MSSASLSRSSLRVLAHALWTIAVGGLRVFAWDSLKHGFIDIRPLPRVLRLLALVGLALVFVFIASILYNDTLRLSGTLESLPLSSSAARGILAPSTAVPLALLASILAWSLMLTGALHVWGWVRAVMLFAFLAFGLPGLIVGAVQAVTGEDPALFFITVGVAALAVLLLLLGLIVLPRFHFPLAFEFVLMLAAVGGLYLLVVYLAARASQMSAINFVSGYVVPDAVTSPRNLIIPFLFLAGAEIVNFGISLSRWGAQSAARFGAPWVFVVLLFVLLAYRLVSFALKFLSSGGTPIAWEAYLGAALVGLGLVPIAVWRARRPGGDPVPTRVVVILIAALVVPQLLLVVVITLVSGIFAIAVTDPNVLQQMDQATVPLLALSELFRSGRTVLVVLGGLVITLLGLRRAQYSLAAFGLVLAWTQVISWLMESGRPLAAWRYEYAELDLWLTLGITTLGVYWLVRGGLNGDRALRLLALAFFAWVLGFTNFLDNPLSLFLGFTGIFFTAFGILWSVITAGGKFANAGSPRFPRASRILMYLGYALMTVNITHWFVVTHNVPEQALNSSFTMSGLSLFGLAAAYLVFVEGGRALLKAED